MSDYRDRKYDITIIRGDPFNLWWALDQADGTVADPPAVGDGYTAGRLTVRDEYDGSEIVIADTDNGALVIGLTTDADGTEWSGYVSIPASATSAMTDWGDGVYDLKITDALHPYTVLWGSARLMPTATEELP